MTPRERILSTIKRQPVDHPPVDIWCTPEVLEDLKLFTGKEDELSIYTALGIDKIVCISPGYAGHHFKPDDSDEITPWGVPTKKMKAGMATYKECINPPIAGFYDTAQLADYPLWPSPDDFDYAGAKVSAEKAGSYQFATLGPWISHFEIYCQMRGLENALMDTLANPDFLEAALDRIEAIQTEMLKRFIAELGDRIDIIFISDDMGMQENLLISIEVWKEHFKPRLKRWCDLIHQYGKSVLFHTDGAVLPLIPELINCGIDILNPIQHACPGMDRALLKERFGKDIIFHGGIDNQTVLPSGTKKDVIDETRTCLETLGRGGGYICCSCHNVQAGTPVENILAMIETVKTYSINF